MKKELPATLMCDFYKLSHRQQYPEGTEVVYSTWTPRMSRIDGVDRVVAFGFQGFIKKYLIDYFNENFFSKELNAVLDEYSRVVEFALGDKDPDVGHIIELHNLGYLPVVIKAVDEGSMVPIRVPMLTIENADSRFFWLTNYLETVMSCEMWMPTTSATLAHQYRQILDRYAIKTAGDTSFVPFQGHDFSMRGMSCLEASQLSGSGHLLSFSGTDTIPAIHYLEQYYNADIEKELVGTSIPATEHSVMCAGGDGDAEFYTYKRLINDVYPSGFLSIVSDTWDLWECLDKIVKPLKEDILNRDGKVVIRPDSGDPVDIICGIQGSYSDNYDKKPEDKGVVEILWDIFGGTVNEQGYKVLDPHIGCIYGDAITISRCTEICERLKKKGFASTNMVYGIGSFTYQYNTRDTFGFALKSTAVTVNGVERDIYKNPKTDSGFKKSQRGRVAVYEHGDDLYYEDGLSKEQSDNYPNNVLTTVFENGKLVKDDSLSDVRSRLNG